MHGFLSISDSSGIKNRGQLGMLEDYPQPNEAVGSYYPRLFAAMMPDPIMSKNENGVQKNKFAGTLCEQVRSVGYHFSGNSRSSQSHQYC